MTLAIGTYAYGTYFETLLNYGPAAKQSQLTATMYYKDSPGRMGVSDSTATADAANLGPNARYEISKASGIIEMARPVFCDVFMSERLLLSFVDLKVIFNTSSNEFCFVASEANTDYRVKLIDASLKIRKVKVSSSISLAHEVALKEGSAIYPIRRVEFKSFIIPAGNPFLRKHNLFNGLEPISLVFELVESAVFNGAYKKNPYNLQHFNVSFIGIIVNGIELQSWPKTMWTVAFDQFLKLKCKICSSFFNPPAPLNNVVF